MEKENLFKQMLDNTNQIIHVSEVDSFSMLYANELAIKNSCHGDMPYEGEKCYKYMLGYDEPCSFCPIHQMNGKTCRETEIDNGQQTFAVKTMITEWEGKKAFVEYAWDVTEIRAAEKAYYSQISALMSSVGEAQMIFGIDVTTDSVVLTGGTSKKVKNIMIGTNLDTMLTMVSRYIAGGCNEDEFKSIFNKEALIRANKEGKNQVIKDLDALFNDGSIRPARVIARLFVNPKNNHLECVLYGIDITLEENFVKKLEKAFEEQAFRLEEITNLNLQLKEKQLSLEHFAAEQKVQLREITSLNKEMEGQLDIIQAMNKVYYYSYLIDLTNDLYVKLYSEEPFEQEREEVCSAQELMCRLCDTEVVQEHLVAMRKFTDLSTLQERLKDKDFITEEFISKTNGWSQAYWIAGKRDENGKFTKAFYSARTIHDEKDRESEYKAIIEGFSREYHTVWVVDKESLKMRLIRTTGVTTIQGAVEMAVRNDDFRRTCEDYTNTYVEASERDRIRRVINPEEVIRNVNEKGFYAVNYLRCDEEGKVGYHQIAFVNADIKNGKKQFVMGFRDIDAVILEERAFKQELREAKLAAEIANNAKTVFLNNMSHDIRTPMNAILGYIKLIDKKKDDPEVIKAYLEKMEKSGEYLLSIINNVLEVSRIDSGMETVDECFTDLFDASGNVAPLLEVEFNRKKLTFTNQMEIVHRYILADMVKIREITMNLMSNAIKYTPEGGKISLFFKEYPCEREGYGLYVNTISDNGIGMSKEFLEHIFDSFSRERNTTESRVIGSGLGMSIVKRLVDLLGGKIEVESELGKGTTFRIIMEHKIVTNPEEYLEKQLKKENKEVNLAGKRILLAEDNELNSEIASVLLKDLGAKVDCVSDGLECVESLDKSEESYYDFILMDIQMPNLNGYEATKRIRAFDNKTKASIPIIAVTANAFEEDKKNAYLAGMNGHLAKPIDVTKLIEIISDIESEG